MLSQKSQYSQRIQNVSEKHGLLRIEEKIPLFDSHIKYISQDKKGDSIFQDEAYYITAILNAPIVKKFMEASNAKRNYSFKNISIFCPKYDEKNVLIVALKNITHQIIELKKDFDFCLMEEKQISTPTKRIPDQEIGEDITTLSKYINRQGRIIPRIHSKLSAKDQRKVAKKKIKTLRQMALLPYIIEKQNEQPQETTDKSPT
ncbi:4767_t:CDS:2 [Cetraspora pellucida]|uniref:Small ribosomal subunit protein bS18m n=1 Tax=Cetraspora pellucida TaxID=1433469 RepID=A0A9N9IIT5_9GLOM|nr:4767_t:CDS:2 [Cetraspora pellucida]